MLKGLLALGIFALMLGCLSQPYSGEQGAGQQNQPPAQPPAVTPTPPPSNPPANPSQPAQTGTNTTQNATPPPAVSPPPSPPPNAVQTDLSAGDLLGQLLHDLPPRDGGPYYKKTYTWVSLEFNASPGVITLSNPTYDVLFDGAADTNLVAFGFTTYAPASGPVSASGYAILYNDSMMLDRRAASLIPTDITYKASGMNLTLAGALLVSKDFALDQKGRLLAIYEFETDSVE